VVFPCWISQELWIQNLDVHPHSQMNVVVDHPIRDLFMTLVAGSQHLVALETLAVAHFGRMTNPISLSQVRSWSVTIDLGLTSPSFITGLLPWLCPLFLSILITSNSLCIATPKIYIEHLFTSILRFRFHFSAFFWVSKEKNVYPLVIQHSYGQSAFFHR
jgi:hypothetical protein